MDRLLEAALQREPGRRADFLIEASGGDESLRRELESLLAAHDKAGSFLETPPGGLAAEMLERADCDLPADQLIGPYKIKAAIGAGGMGEVYLAEDTRLDRRVALKILPRNVAADPDRMRRFIREAKAASAIAHQNICTVYDIGETPDHRPFIAMEHIEGQTVAARIAGPRLESPEIIDICGQVADALEEAHSKGIVHRDIKPANIMITSRGLVKVLDFGLAKIGRSGQGLAQDAITQAETASGVVMGTVKYMSPEQALGRDVDHRSDIFSLGTVMYEMAAGRVPFAGPNTTETIDRIIHASPDPISQDNHTVSAELERNIFKCLEKDREHRFRSAREVGAALRSPGPNTHRKVGLRARGIGDFKDMLVVIGSILVIATALVFATRSRKPASLPQPETRSLAVLPLKSLSADANDDYLGLGISDSIITRLSQISGLSVRPTSAVRGYSSNDKGAMDAAKELKVDSVLEGTVQRAGDRLRLNLILRSAPGDIALWSDSFEVSSADAFLMQDDVANKVTARLRFKLAPQQANRVIGQRPTDPIAYDYYLRGLFHLGRQGRLDVEEAIANLEKAVKVDPGFAIGWAQLANAYNNKTFLFAPDDKQLQEKSFAAVNTALDLDPNLAEAYLARGILLWTHYNGFPHDQTVEQLRRALNLNPNLDDAHQRLALLYVHVGLADKALQEAREAVNINPNNFLALQRMAGALQLKGKYNEALDVYDKMPKEVTPALWASNSARALFYLGRKDEAWRRIEEALRTVPEDEGGVLTSTEALLLAAAGNTRNAKSKIEKAITIGKDFGHFHHATYNIASAYALMNEPEPAMKWLEFTAQDGMPCYPLFEQDSNLANLKGYHRFDDFMTKLKKQFEQYRSTL